MTIGNTKVNSPRAYTIEVIMFLSYAFFAINWIAGSTLTPQIMQYFKLESFASATFISNAITFAKIIGNLMAASLLVKLNPKKAILLASFLIVGGSMVGVFAPNYLIFIIARFIMGFGGALIVVYFGPIVLNYFSNDRRPLINGLNAIAYNVGSIIAMIVVAPVVQLMATWQNSMLFFALCSLVLLVLWFIIGEDFELNKTINSSSSTNSQYTLKQALKERFSYIFPLSYAGILTLYIVILTIFPISNSAAINPKILSATVAVAGVCGALIGIQLTKKLTKRLPIIRLCGLLTTLSAATMILIPSSTGAIAAAAGVGLFMFMPMTALVTIPQELPQMTAQKLTLIMGIFWSFSYIFETILYYVIGVVIDSSGFQAGLLVAVAVSLSFFIGSFFLPETGRPRVA